MAQLNLRSIDIPQIHRFGVGFDTMVDRLEEIIRINAKHNVNYPPYNLIKYDEDNFTIEIAVAGFKTGEVSIIVKDNELVVEGKQLPQPEQVREYIHQGISGRNFQRVFWLNDHVVVKDARQENGILTIELQRIIPEEKKAKSIPITYIA